MIPVTPLDAAAVAASATMASTAALIRGLLGLERDLNVESGLLPQKPGPPRRIAQAAAELIHTQWRSWLMSTTLRSALTHPGRGVVQRLRRGNVRPQRVLEAPRDERPRQGSAIIVHARERFAHGTHHLFGRRQPGNTQPVPVLGPQREVNVTVNEPRHQPTPIEVDALRTRIHLSAARAPVGDTDTTRPFDTCTSTRESACSGAMRPTAGPAQSPVEMCRMHTA